MSDPTGCVCDPKSFPFVCERHGCRKGPHFYGLCQSDPAAFAKYERGEGPGQMKLPDAPAPVMEPTADSLHCVHRGKIIRQGECDLCGLKGQSFEILGCAVHGDCSISRKHSKVQSCVACVDRKEPEAVATKPVPSHQFLRDGKGDRVTGFFNRYRGGSAFLICGGPSLEQTPLHLLRNPGLLTAAVNNAAVFHRPNLWFGVDIPGNFSEAIWRDSAIEKFLIWKRNSERLRRWNPATKRHEAIEAQAREMPNTWFYDHDKGFDPNQFLIQAKPTWGWRGMEDGPAAMACDVMLPALRILHWMGIRTLYIVGADFKMTQERPYAFDEQSSKGRVAWNNRKFKILNGMFKQMEGHFAEYGFRVFNCTPGGNLTAFPRMGLPEAVERALHQAEFPREIVTRGHYSEA